MKETIGFIGLGLMGRPMAKNLVKAGYPVVVHSRSRGPVDDLVSAGARAADSPAAVARQATRVITMVPDSPDVELVLDGPNGVFKYGPHTTMPTETFLASLSTATALGGRSVNTADTGAIPGIFATAR